MKGNTFKKYYISLLWAFVIILRWVADLEQGRMLRRSQRELLGWIIAFTREHKGVGPMQRHVAEGLGVSNPYESLTILQRRGYIAQVYEGGPWVPVRDPEGRELRLVLQVVET